MLTPTWLRDTAERALFTFIEAFLSAFLLDGVFDMDTAKKAAFAGVAAALTVAKSAIAALFGGTVSPASLAPGPAGTTASGGVPPRY